MSYDMIDRFLRNNLDDDDYAEYSLALDQIASPPASKPWVGLTNEEIENCYGGEIYDFARAIEAKLKAKNEL